MSAEHIAVLTPHSYLPCSLQGVLLISEGYLILRGASRLDAFSVYPFRTWLLCHGSDSQQIHQWSVHPGPLVLRTAPLKYPPPHLAFRYVRKGAVLRVATYEKTPRVGLEPTTTRLTAECSTIELSRKMSLRSKAI